MNDGREFPRLRTVSPRYTTHLGRQVVMIEDPLQIAQRTVVIAPEIAPVLLLCDGTTPAAALAARAHERFGIEIGTPAIEKLLRLLDDALLLESPAYDTAHAAARAAYHAAPHRPMTFAGQAYPADATTCAALLDGYLDAAGDVRQHAGQVLLSPHIDYPRGSAIYAQLYKRAHDLLRDAELVILLGTDHHGGELFTLTRQQYATPLGVLPNDDDARDALATAIGAEAAYAGELLHTGEHSLELVALWLQHIRGSAVPVVPLLCGSFARYMIDGTAPLDNPGVAATVRVLRELLSAKRTVIVASGDLSHVGPAFGGTAQREQEKLALRASDYTVMRALERADADAMYQAIVTTGDSTNICGTAPFFLALSALAGNHGHRVGYAQCPADNRNTSVVSITGVIAR